MLTEALSAGMPTELTGDHHPTAADVLRHIRSYRRAAVQRIEQYATVRLCELRARQQARL
jgi:hypothetical protein